MKTITEMKEKHAELRKAFRAAERKLDRKFSDAAVDKLNALFDAICELEKEMIAAGIPC